MTVHPGSVPTSTYRLQLGGGMTFDDAAEVADYLAALGAGALYSSPVLAATPGSPHGYDVADPTRASPALGGEEGRGRLAARLRVLGLGLVLDIVPNHVGVAVPEANPWWWDVLTHGRSSRYARYFDIDWAAGPILLPVLDADEAGALEQLRVVDGRLRYHEHAFPLAPGTETGTPAEVHERQHYRLVSWRRATAELTYRRFFDIATLAALRVEDPDVFADASAEVLRWVSAGEVSGLRVDHPDGLAEPGGYLRRLRAAGPGMWLLVEKILGVGESLPVSWPADGTTGYDALREVCGLFVDPAAEGLLTQFAAERTGSTARLHHLERQCKRMVAQTILVAEVRRIAKLLPEVPAERAEAAVAEILSAFPVYRSYLPEGRAALDVALSAARTARPDLIDVIDVIGSASLREQHGDLATRIQQTSPMVMAKGVEDTAFYRWNRFVALNEVGGDPARFGVLPREFHAAAAAREAGWPATMTALSTHDTKRSEDVRARLAVLAELPAHWVAAVRGWMARAPLPEPSLELLAWQSLVGAWPIDAARMREYLTKAAKEAKLVTSHVDPVPEVDEAIAAWPEAVLGDAELTAEVAAFVERICEPGWSNSLGQKLLQLAGPGVPDVYQGTELFEYSLVDPDNRRPVDFVARRELLARIDEGRLPPVDATGAAKLLVTAQVLRLRRDEPGLFRGYRPVAAEGPAAEHVVAFRRSPRLVAVATRLPVGLAARGGWADTVLPLPPVVDGGWTEALTGRSVTTGMPRLADLLARFPVALLRRG